MKKLVSVFLGIVAALMCASAQAGTVGGITIEYVGLKAQDNFPQYPQFESTGGDGFVVPSGVVKSFTSLGNVPIILRSDGFCGDGFGLVAQPECALFVKETVTNKTGVDWTDFHMRIVPIDQAVTVSFGLVLLDFGGFDSFEVSADTLSLFGLVKDGESFGVSFELLASGEPNGAGGRFGITETPSVPEPATLALVGLGLAGLGYGRRRKGR